MGKVWKGMPVAVLVLAAISAPTPTAAQAAAMRPLRGEHAAAARPTPRTPVGWLRRAYDETNIRFPGSAPFEMRVTFHAFAGIDFAPKGKSPIMTGDGTYRETWVSPHRWRREVTFGSYHAVEVEAAGVRKFQASSDYEPSRVLMLMRALVYPIPRHYLEPELEQSRIHWKLKHLTLGGLAYIQAGYESMPLAGTSTSDRTAFDFLPDGILFRLLHYGMLTSWRDPVRFGGRLVPTRVAVQGLGLGRNLVAAEVRIEPVAKGAEKIAQIAGPPARPGSTLRPFGISDIRTGPKHLNTPGFPPGKDVYPQGVVVYTRAVIDRQGLAREPEVVGIDIQGQRPSAAQFNILMLYARNAIEGYKKVRYVAPTVDGAPCEFIAWVILVPPRML